MEEPLGTYPSRGWPETLSLRYFIVGNKVDGYQVIERNMGVPLDKGGGREAHELFEADV